MGYICNIIGHSWEQGRCRRCGELHKQHQWLSTLGKCKLCCSVCGLEKDIEHHWTPVNGLCKEKCSICGAEMSFEHDWEQHGCISKCLVCGEVKESHLWVKHQCSICQIFDQAVQEIISAAYVNVEETAVSRLLDELNQETLAEIAITAKSSYLCHAAKDRVFQPACLLYILDRTENTYIENEIKQKFICPHCGNHLDVCMISRCKCQDCGKEVHDYRSMEITEIDMPDFSSGIRYKKCVRCGNETEHKDFSYKKIEIA